MTTDQEHLLTLLLVKYGGLKTVVDIWLYSDAQLSPAEIKAVSAWLEVDRTDKPYNLQAVKDAQHPYLTAEITLNPTDKD